MTALKEREYVKGVYPSTSWQKKVDAMNDAQVIAIYIRLREEAHKSSLEKEPDTHPDQGRLF